MRFPEEFVSLARESVNGTPSQYMLLCRSSLASIDPLSLSPLSACAWCGLLRHARHFCFRVRVTSLLKMSSYIVFRRSSFDKKILCRLRLFSSRTRRAHSEGMLNSKAASNATIADTWCADWRAYSEVRLFFYLLYPGIGSPLLVFRRVTLLRLNGHPKITIDNVFDEIKVTLLPPRSVLAFLPPLSKMVGLHASTIAFFRLTTRIGICLPSTRRSQIVPHIVYHCW